MIEEPLNQIEESYCYSVNLEKQKKSRKIIRIIWASIIVVMITGFCVGATYYRNSANQAACIINLSSITKAAHAYQ